MAVNDEAERRGCLFFWRGLRGQLILTYSLVTVLALLALEVLALLVIGAAGSISLTLDPNRDGYFHDIVSTLAPQARPYLRPGAVDADGLQAWLAQVHAQGLASLPPQHPGDSPAAPLAAGQPLYVLSPAGVVLAQAPASAPSQVGQAYAAPPRAAGALHNALAGQPFALTRRCAPPVCA